MLMSSWTAHQADDAVDFVGADAQRLDQLARVPSGSLVRAAATHRAAVARWT